MQMNELYCNDNVKIEAFALGDFETNCYLLTTANEYILIDAPPGICSILKKGCLTKGVYPLLFSRTAISIT